MSETASTGERQHYGATLAVLAISALAFALSQTMVAPALPEIQRDLGATTTEVTFVLTIYLLTASVATPILGRLGDMFGKVRVLVLVLLAFGIGSLVAALSTSIEVLVLGRAIQGAGGAIFPLAFGIIRDEFPPQRVAAGIGLISATFGIGGGGGLVLSGLIVDHLAYEWLFWLGLIVIVIALVLTMRFIPESPVRTPARIDWLGAVLLAATLVALLFGVSRGNAWGWDSARVLGLFAAALVFAVIWVRFELRASDPMVDIDVMRLRGVWTTNLCGLLIGFGMFGSFILIPQLVQLPTATGFGFGETVTGAGLFLLPSTAGMLVAGPAAGLLAGRIGSRLPLTVGTIVAGASFVLLAAAHDEPWQIYLASTLLGIGIGFSFAAMANLIVAAVPAQHTGSATGINSVARTVGGALGGQIAASIVAGHLVMSSGLPSERGFTVAFTLSACMMALALLATLLVPRHGAPNRVEAGSTVLPIHSGARG